MTTADVFASVAAKTAKLLQESSINIGTEAITKMIYNAASTVSGHADSFATNIGLPGVGLGALAGGRVKINL